MAKPANALASLSTNAGQLLDQLLAAINQPVAADLGGAVSAVDTAFARRSVDAVVRSKDEIQIELDRARRMAIKAELDNDIENHGAAADRVAVLERELADVDVKRQALSELREERREVVGAVNTALGDKLAAYRHEVGESAKALEVEALRLWSIAATARKAVETTESRFDRFGMMTKTHEMEVAIADTKRVIPPAWSSALTVWWRVHEWICRP